MHILVGLLAHCQPQDIGHSHRVSDIFKNCLLPQKFSNPAGNLLLQNTIRAKRAQVRQGIVSVGIRRKKLWLAVRWTGTCGTLGAAVIAGTGTILSRNRGVCFSPRVPALKAMNQSNQSILCPNLVVLRGSATQVRLAFCLHKCARKSSAYRFGMLFGWTLCATVCRVSGQSVTRERARFALSAFLRHACGMAKEY